MRNLLRLLGILWVAPNSAIGLLLGLSLLLGGARVQLHRGVVEIAWRPDARHCGRAARWLPYRAITFGHVVLAVTAEDMDACRAHERVHVAQYERWGVFFLVAYAASSAWQLLKGRDPYWDNAFEVQARIRAADKENP